MRQSGCTALVTAAVVALGVSVSAQKTTLVHPGKAGSAHVKTAWVIDGANITIEYGQPQLKGRADAAVMPPGKPWRTGADEATVLVTDKALKFGIVQSSGRDIHDQHAAGRQGLAADLRQARETWSVGYSTTSPISKSAAHRCPPARPRRQSRRSRSRSTTRPRARRSASSGAERARRLRLPSVRQSTVGGQSRVTAVSLVLQFQSSVAVGSLSGCLPCSLWLLVTNSPLVTPTSRRNACT